MSEGSPRVVFVSGLSGSGKSTAMAALEDLAFYCVDNLPVQLTQQFLDLCGKATPPIDKIALAIDTREESFFGEVPRVIEELRRGGAALELMFLECADEVLIDRYRETRRVHPLAPAGSVEEGIERERSLLVELARLADVVIDTSGMNVHQLKAAVVRQVSGRARPTVVNVTSFGFRFGPPHSAELLFDVRFLPNPYFEEHLRQGTGRDAEVAEYVLKSSHGASFLGRLVDFCRFLLPLYDEEGKAYLTISVGCTGGQHRSVAIAEALAAELRREGREVNVEHRDVERST